MFINITEGTEMTQDEIIKVLEDKSLLQPDGCWEWTGSKTGAGYPQYYVGGARNGSRYVNARHLAVAAALGRPVAPGLDAFSTCLHRWCVNPDHFEEQTRSYIRKAVRAAKEASAPRDSVADIVNAHTALFNDLLEALYNAEVIPDEIDGLQFRAANV